MSRVTNSILLRFGITQFWSSSLFKRKTTNLLLILNSLLILILKNNFLQIIKTQYLIDSIILYVLKFNNEKLSFLEKYLFLQKNKLKNLKYRKNYSVKYVLKKREDKIILNAKKLQYVTFLRVYLNFDLLRKKINYFLVFPFFKFRTLHKTKKNIYFWKLFKIKKLNYYIKLKILGLFISDLIFNYSTKKIRIVLKTITESIQFVKLPFFFNKMKINFDKKHIFFRLLLSFMFFSTKIISYDINKLILNVKNKKHINALRSYFRLVKILFLTSVTCLRGIKIQLAGRLNGKLRKSRFGYVLGSVKLMTLTTDCAFSLEPIYTQYGVFSLKIWFSH